MRIKKQLAKYIILLLLVIGVGQFVSIEAYELSTQTESEIEINKTVGESSEGGSTESNNASNNVIDLNPTEANPQNTDIKLIKIVNSTPLSIQIIQLLITVLGGGFALYQWKKNVMIKRTQFANSMIDMLRSDEEIRSTSNLFDSNYGDWFGKEFFNNPRFEIAVDKTLSYYSYICYLQKFNLITKHEFAFFKYEIHVTLLNHNVIDYLYNYYHYCKARDLANAYIYLLNYGQDNDLVDGDFYDNNAYKKNNKFSKVLDF